MTPSDDLDADLAIGFPGVVIVPQDSKFVASVH